MITETLKEIIEHIRRKGRKGPDYMLNILFTLSHVIPREPSPLEKWRLRNIT